MSAKVESMFSTNAAADSRVTAAGLGLGPILSISKLRQNKFLWEALRTGRVVDFSMNQLRRVELFDRETTDFDDIEMVSFAENEFNDFDFKNLTAFRNLTAISLSHNKLKSVVNINYIPHLRTLDLSHNQLDNLRLLRNLEVTRQIEKLDVSFNKFLSRTSIAEITQMDSLRVLNIQNNLFYLDLQMEAFCILACPSLEELNDQPVTATVRHEVETWVTQTPEGKEVLAFVRDAVIALESRGVQALKRLETADSANTFGQDKEEEALRRAVEVATPHARSPVLLADQEHRAIQNRLNNKGESRILSPAGEIVAAQGEDGEGDDEARAAYEASARKALGVQRTHLLLDWFSSLAAHRPSAKMPLPQRAYEPLKLSTLKSWAKFKNASMSAWKREMDYRSTSVQAYREKLESVKRAAAHCASENETHFNKYLQVIEDQERSHLAFKQSGGEMAKYQQTNATPGRTFAHEDEQGNLSIRRDAAPDFTAKRKQESQALAEGGDANHPSVPMDDPILLERSRRMSTTAMMAELQAQQPHVDISHDWSGVIGGRKSIAPQAIPSMAALLRQQEEDEEDEEDAEEQQAEPLPFPQKAAVARGESSLSARSPAPAAAGASLRSRSRTPTRSALKSGVQPVTLQETYKSPYAASARTPPRSVSRPRAQGSEAQYDDMLRSAQATLSHSGSPSRHYEPSRLGESMNATSARSPLNAVKSHAGYNPSKRSPSGTKASASTQSRTPPSRARVAASAQPRTPPGRVKMSDMK